MAKSIIAADLTPDQELIQTLIGSSKDGIVVLQAIRNGNGVITDFRFSFANRLAKPYLKGKKVGGKSLLSLMPELENSNTFLRYVQVAESGKTRFQESDAGPKKIKVMKFGDGIILICPAIPASDSPVPPKMPEQAENGILTLNNIPDMITRWDGQGRLLFANPAMEEKTGIPKGLMYGKTKMEIGMPADNAIPWTDKIRQVYETGMPAEHHNHILSGKEKVYLFTRLVPEKDKDGRTTSVLAISRDVTEIRKKELELAEKNENLKNVQTLGHIGDFCFNETTGEVIWSDELYRIMGVPIGEPMDFGKAISFYEEEDKQRLVEMVQHTLRTGEEIEMETAFIPRGNDRTKYLFITGRAFTNNTGHIIGIKGIVQDITATKKAELALRESKQQLESVLENTSSSIMTLKAIRNEKGVIVDFEYLFTNNRTLESVKRDSLIGKRLLEEFPSGSQNGLFMHYKEVVYTGHDWCDEVCIDDGGLNVWSQVYAKKFNDGILVSYVDITRRKKSEQELRKKIGLLNEAERMAHMGSWDWDIHKNTMTWSDQMHKIYQTERGDANFNYQDFRAYIHPDDKEKFDGLINKALIDHKPFDVVYRILLNDGSVRHLKGAAAVSVDENRRAVSIIGIAQDITEQNEMKEATVRAEAEKQLAMKALRFKQQFLSNMSHEIRTPLTAIIGFTEEVLKTSIGTKQRQYINAIKVSGDALLALVNDILDLAKVDAGKMRFDEQPFHPAACVRNMLLLFETKIQQKKLELIKNYDTRIPAVLLGDPARLNQIILNLVSNAVKFTHKGSITVNIDLLSEDQEKALIKFSISDTGIGISEASLEHIFESFQQGSSHTSRIYGGTGLGLSIVKQLAEAQGGCVEVKSTLDEGSTFGVIIPFKKATAKRGHPIAREPEKIELKVEANKEINVLVVEDVDLNQLLMKVVLTNMGFIPDIAANGKIALEKLRQKKYHIVLMDLQMPVMNGFEATEIIRKELGPDIPIIALTADVTSNDVQKIRDCGMDDYVTKPIDQEKLYKKMMERLDM